MGNYYAPEVMVFPSSTICIAILADWGCRDAAGPKGTEPDIPFIRFKNYLKAAPVSSDSAYIIGAPLDDVRYLYGVLPANREAYVLKGDIPILPYIWHAI